MVQIFKIISAPYKTRFYFFKKVDLIKLTLEHTMKV